MGDQRGMSLRVKQTDEAPLALVSGRGVGGEGFALCFDWFFDREFNL